jgi:propane monooxygenase coupling protein
VTNTNFEVNNTSSNMCGCTIMNNQDGYDIAEVMRTKPNVTATLFPSMIRIDAKGSVEFNFDEIGDALGYGQGDFTQANFEEVMSTHYGRMINLDDRTVFFANPEDAAEYLGFDLQPV